MPTFKELVQGKADAWSNRNKQAFKSLLDVNSFVPVSGDIQSGLLAANDIKNGDYGSAALNGLGLLPFLPSLGGAIKVFHGSPHKFDKFDMSKIGTGEGAQAYGHGLYFADSPEVAKGYAENVKDMGTVRDINNKLSELSKIMDADSYGYRKFRTDAGKNAAKQYDELIARRDAVREDPGTMYEVSLRHPDPAKEAATPLSPDDFLQWDKPFNEQPESVKKAYLDFVKSPQGMEYAKEFHGYEDGMTIRDLPKSPLKAPFGQTIYKNGFNGWDNANEWLTKHGVPGIRYLDGNSRNAGQGTANYVVFDDSLPEILSRNGLLTDKAPARPLTKYEQAHEVARKNAVEMLGLPENNTAMDRAKALGFDTETKYYHGSGKKINEFKPWQARKNRSSDGIFFTDDKELAKQYGRVANEAYLKKGKNIEYDANGNSFSDTDTQNFLLRNLRRLNGESSVTMNNFVDAPNPFLNSSTSPSRVIAVNQPNQIRSPNAAFDPARVNESDLLGYANPQILPALTASGLLGAGLLNYRSKQDKPTK